MEECERYDADAHKRHMAGAFLADYRWNGHADREQWSRAISFSCPSICVKYITCTHVPKCVCVYEFVATRRLK